jgi:DNA helicase-2/ATP-dependent DNA helicase PcrA
MGRSTVNKASRFIQDIPKKLVSGGEIWQAAESSLGSSYTPGKAASVPEPAKISLPELKSGDRVHHSQFGEGIIVSCNPRSGDNEIVVAFSGVGIKKLLQSFAKLEKAN